MERLNLNKMFFLMLSKSHSRNQDQEHNADHAHKGGHHGSAHCLAESTELVANGQPVGAGVAIVS